ncbi:MAG: hypothetical protein WCI21_01510 [Alphaproteobacteria bacterium]
MDDAARLEVLIDRFSPKVAAEARAALAKARALMPGMLELAYDNYNALGIGFSHTEKASGTAISIVLYPRWVSLFFLRGANLHDPHGLLVGKGSQVRHIVLDREDLLDDPRVLALIDQELNRSGRASNPLAERRVMIMVCTP